MIQNLRLLFVAAVCAASLILPAHAVAANAVMDIMLGVGDEGR